MSGAGCAAKNDSIGLGKKRVVHDHGQRSKATHAIQGANMRKT